MLNYKVLLTKILEKLGSLKTVATSGEFNDLNNGFLYRSFTVSNGVTSTFQISDTMYALVTITGPSADARGLYIIYGRSSQSSLGVTAVKSGDIVPTYSATGKFTISNSSGYSSQARFMIFVGDISLVTT